MDILIKYIKNDDTVTGITSKVVDRFISDLLLDQNSLGEYCVTNDRHFLKETLLSCINSESGDRLTYLKKLVEIPWISKWLKPLLIIYSWRHLMEDRSPAAVAGLKDLLLYSKADDRPASGLMSQACCILRSQLQVIESLHHCSPDVTDRNDSHEAELCEIFDQAFCDLLESSVLPAILTMGQLQNMSIDVLQNLPFIRSSSEIDFSTRKVRFQEADDEEETELIVPDDRVRDISIFRGYSILRDVMNVIYRDSVSRKLSLSSKRSSRLSLQREISLEDNEKYIGDLETAEKHLKELYPLNFRLEIMENVFSLLFVRSDDLNESCQIVALPNAEETDLESVRSWNSIATSVKEGFSCCNDYLVRSILTMLKEVAIVTSSLAKSPQNSSAIPTTCSIPNAELPSRLSSFQQKINDALWRLDVVIYPPDIPLSLNPAYTDDLARPSFLTRALDARKSNKRRRQRKRKSSTILKKHVDTSVVEKMLSGPLVLLKVCLHRGTFDLADQVLKIFNLEDEMWTKEVVFGHSHLEVIRGLFLSRDKKPKRKTSMISLIPERPLLSPAPDFNEFHIETLVRTDFAFLCSVADFANCGAAMKMLKDYMTEHPVPFPTPKSMHLQNRSSFEEFIKNYLETSVALSHPLPVASALPFNPSALQSVNAFLEDIGNRVVWINKLLLEPGKKGNTGMTAMMQLNKILRKTVRSSGGLINLIRTGLPAADGPNIRTGYVQALLTFMRTYASCMKLDPDMDNFQLMYQSPYNLLLRCFGAKATEMDGDELVKNLSLDIPRMLFRGFRHEEPHQSSYSVGGPVVLNSLSLDQSFFGSFSPVHLSASVLVRVLKVFQQEKDDIYAPKKVSWPMIADYFESLSLLERAQLDTLKSDPERLCFFINVYNLLFIHAGSHARRHSSFETVSRWEKDPVATKLHFWRYRYRIGFMGEVSLQNLFDGLSPLRAASFSYKLETTRLKENAFLMANSALRLSVHVLYPELLKSTTAIAVMEYLEQNVVYEAKRNAISLPSWIFQVYPSDQLVDLVQKHGTHLHLTDWEGVTWEPIKKVASYRRIPRKNTTFSDGYQCLEPKAKRRAEAEDADEYDELNIELTTSFPVFELPLDDLLPFVASPCSFLSSLLSSNGAANILLPTGLSNRTVLKLIHASHRRFIPVDLLCTIFSEMIGVGQNPVAIINSPLLSASLAASPAGGLLQDIVIAMAVEKNLAQEPWLAVGRIRDLDLRLRCTQLKWKLWPVSQCVDLFDLMTFEDPRPVIKSMQIRVASLQQVLQALCSDRTAWQEIFPQGKLTTVLSETSLRDVEKRLEQHFSNFVAAVLRLDKVEPLNAWLQNSEMPSLTVYEEELQLRGLVHMLDAKPPMILSAYQLLIPMLKNCQFERVEQLLESINSPEGRLPVIKIAVLCGRFNEDEVAVLKEKEVENLVLIALPEFFRKSIAHLQGHTLLMLEQLIIWNKLDYLANILKIPHLFEVFSRRLFESMLVDYAKKAVAVSEVKSSRSGSITGDDNRNGIDRNDLRRKDSVATPVKGSFVMPPSTPSRNEWIESSAVTKCMVCGEKFTVFNRKHHCRRCGRVVCSQCSAQTIQIDVYGDNPVRACDDCFDHTIAAGSSLRSSKSSGGISFSAPIMRSPPTSSPARLLPPRIWHNGTEANEQQKWMFTTDDVSNQRLRNEFFFVSAPDAALCVGLLKLHSDLVVAGKELLKLSNELSEWVGSHEDCGLENTTILGTMRSLLFNAKVLLHSDREATDWATVCDNYLNQIQLIEMLLEAGVPKIPSVQDLADRETIRKIRDQLAHQERYSLAIEISTKAGLDPGDVLLTWGRCLLKVGKFPEAEEKLSKCLKPPLDKTQTFPPSATVLDEIMDLIMNAKMPRRRGTLSADSVVQLVLHGDVLRPDAVDPGLIEQENFRKVTECLRYQEMYGTHASLLKFYMKRGLIQKALEYTLREAVNVETFIDTIVLPSLKAGQMRTLEDELLMSDASLNKWAEYLTAICKQLTKRGMNHTLMSFQLFMKDYLRAATTSVMFFQNTSAADSYQVYLDRIHHLEDAQKYVILYLETIHSSKDDDSHKFLLRLPEEEVRRYLRTIQLQILITQTLSSRSRLEDRRPSASTAALPTLFGNTVAKIDLIAILLEHHTSAKAEDYLLSVIQLYGLSLEEVFVTVSNVAGKERMKGITSAVQTLKERNEMNEEQFDELVLKMANQASTYSFASASKEWEQLIKQMKSEEKRVEAFAKAGKLKSAYLMAVNMRRSDLIELIASQAAKTGDAAVESICKRWLEQNGKVRR